MPNKTKKTKDLQRPFQGQENIEDLLNFEEKGINSQSTTLPDAQERAPLLYKNCKQISPTECFQELVKKHENNDVQNIYFMCLSFILQSEEEIKIKGNSSRTILTNYIFKEKTKKRNVKSKIKQEEEETFQRLSAEMKYFVCSEFSANSPIQIQATQGLLSDIMDRALFLNIANYSGGEITIAPKTALAKIFFYFQ